MSRIGNILKKTFSYVGGLASKRPVTFIDICAGTLTAVILTFYWTDVIKSDRNSGISFEAILTQLLIFFSLYCLCAFLTESGLFKTKVPKAGLIPVHLVGAIISFTLGSVLYTVNMDKARGILLYDLWKRIGTSLADGRIISWTAGFCIITFALGLFFSFIRMENPSFAAFLSCNYSRLFFAYITFLVLLAGTATLTGIFTVLLWGDFTEIYAAVFALIFGGYYIMRFIACFTEETEEPNIFVSVLIRYVMLIMSIAAFVIIYIYMIKILVLKEFPSNEVFEILTSLFVASMPVAYMAAGLLRDDEGASSEEKMTAEEVSEENNEAAGDEASAVNTSGQEKSASTLLYRLASYLPFIFIPFIFLQIYTAGARIAQYGLTPKRYLGLAMIAFEIVYIVLYSIFYKVKERRISIILPVIAGFALICAWMPGVNALDLSKSVQISFIRSYLKDAASDDKTDKARRAAAAYEYITDIDDTLAKKMFSSEETERLELLVNRRDDDDYYLSTDSLIWHADDEMLDIDTSGYERMQYGYLAASGKNAAGLKETGLYLNEGQELGGYLSAANLEEEYKCTLRTDLSVFKDDHILYGGRSNGNIPDDMGFEEAMDADNLITLDNGGAFYITDTDIEYDSKTGDIKNLLLKGYYLSR